MAQSSIHIEKVTTGSFLHNDRTMMPSYLIDDSALNECSRSSQESLEQYYKLKAEAEHNYTERTGQKMQKSTVLLKEAIVNLEAHHTLKDLQPIIKELEGYGFTVLQSAIHRDEGFLNDDTKEKNYHAHITMFNLDPETGKSVKLGKNYRQELSKLQTITANVLGMERGKVSVEEEAKKLGVEVEKASKRLGTHTYKRAMVLKENATKELTQEIKAKDYTLKEMQSRIVNLEGANTELRKELHAQNREINKTQDLEAKERKITELEAKLKEIEGKNTELIEQVIAKDQAIDQLKEAQPEPINVQLQNENKMLKVINQGLEIELKEAKSATVPNRAAVEIPQGDIEQIKKLKEVSEEWAKEISNPNFSKKENFEDLEAFVKKDRDPQKVAIAIYNSHIVPDTGLMGKLGGEKKDEKLLMDNMAKEIGRLQNMLKSSVEMLKSAEVTRSRLTDSLKNVIKGTETAIKSFFRPKERDLSPEVKKERTEPNLSNSDKIRGFIDQIKGNEPTKEQEKPKSRGMER